MTAHPELEELSAYAGDDLDAERAAVVGEHVAGCPQCRADVEGLVALVADLRAVPELTMPDDVAASLEAALRHERARPTVQTADVLPLAPRRRGRWAGWAAGAVAASLIGVVALGALNRTTRGANDGTATRSEAAGDLSDAPFAVACTGTQYTVDNVARGAAAFLKGSACAKDADTGAPSGGGGSVVVPDSATGSKRGTGSPSTQEFSSGNEALALRQYAPLARCLELVIDPETKAEPVAVDVEATFEGQPAYVIVLPFRDNQYDVYVVSREICGQQGSDAGTLHFVRITA